MEIIKPQRVGVLALCDDTLDFIRTHGGGLLPVYAGLTFPFAMACVFFIEAVNSRNTPALPLCAFFLLVTGFVRWLGGAAVQRRAQAIRQGRAAPSWAAMFRSFFFLRFALQPMLAGPLAIDPLTRAKPLASCFKVRGANRRFFTTFLAVTTLFYCIAMLQILAFHYFLLEIILPGVLGFDSQVFRAVLYSRFWWMSLFVVFMLATEFFELVAGVLAYESLASRWSGADLIGRVARRFSDAGANGRDEPDAVAGRLAEA